MRILLVGETGLGKTVTALTLSQFFKTVYIDTEEGTELWKQHFKLDNCSIYRITEWNNGIPKFIENATANTELAVIDSLNSLMDHYVDYLESYVKTKQKIPIPTAGAMTELKVDPEFVVLPYQVWTLVYDTMLNIVMTAIRNSKHVIVCMHPIETRQLSVDGKIIHSHGRLKFVQAIYRQMDIILKFKSTMLCDVVKCRGRFDKPSNVEPVSFLKELTGVKE